MKRSKFLAALGAAVALPFLSFSKEEKKKKEPFIIRHNFVVPDEMRDCQDQKWVEKWEDQMERMMFDQLQKSKQIATKRTIDKEGRTVIMKMLVIQPII